MGKTKLLIITENPKSYDIPWSLIEFCEVKNVEILVKHPSEVENGMSFDSVWIDELITITAPEPIDDYEYTVPKKHTMPFWANNWRKK